MHPTIRPLVLSQTAIVGQLVRLDDAFISPDDRRSRLKRLADMLWALRGAFNDGEADPAKPSKNLEALILECFASWMSCAAEDPGFDAETFKGLYNGLVSALEEGKEFPR